MIRKRLQSALGNVEASDYRVGSCFRALCLSHNAPQRQTVQDRIQQLQNQIRQEQQAALQDEATAGKLAAAEREQQYGQRGPCYGSNVRCTCQSAANSANAHRSRAQQLQYELMSSLAMALMVRPVLAYFPNPSTAVLRGVVCPPGPGPNLIYRDRLL